MTGGLGEVLFLAELGSSDPRFKRIRFHEGLNLLVAEKTEDSQQGDSRNGTGKSSFVRILRYVLGGGLSDELKSSDLAEHDFEAVLFSDSAVVPLATVSRPVSPTTRLTVSGWNGAAFGAPEHIDDWRKLVASVAFSLDSDVARPTLGQLWGQLIPTYFGNPVKSHPSEADWETGVKLGYLLGLDEQILGQAGEIPRLEKQRTAVRGAIREGAIGYLDLDEAALRARAAELRNRRERMRAELSDFRVDNEYREHQVAADSLSAQIRALNDDAIAIERRVSDLRRALEADAANSDSSALSTQLAELYSEVGIVLPELVSRRFDEVAAFHHSILQNRANFLGEELEAGLAQLQSVSEERSLLDERRSAILRLLRDSVALDTFLEAQNLLSEVESQVAETERRLESAVSIGNVDDRIRTVTAATATAVRSEVADRSSRLDRPIALFAELGREIYTDRSARLLVSTTSKGVLKVEPEIDGDASDGIKGVATFLLDIVCLIEAIDLGRAPRLLVHDSHLFDAVDHRQVASCLNIGARLADLHGFQYIVTMNSDFLSSVESEGAFSREGYVVDQTLTDASEDGGLFGFKFA